MNILAIDDEEDILNLVEEICDFEDEIKRPVMVYKSSTLEEAKECLSSQEINCIVLDINLKGSNGGEIVSFLKTAENLKTSKSCPIIITSGFINEDFSEKYHDVFKGILSKPFQSTELKELILKTVPKICETVNESQDDMPISLSIPFPIEELEPKAKAILVKIKKNNKIKGLLKSFKVNRDPNNFFNSHTGLLINLCLAISKKMQWSTDKTLEKFVYAAYLHDIGLKEYPELSKIKNLIDFEGKKDRLTDKEKDIFYNHPIDAYNAIINIPGIPQDVDIIISQHHELPNGNGFPKGIKGSRITPLSSLFIVAHDLVHYMIDNPKWNIKTYIKKRQSYFKGNQFSKILDALHELA